MVFGQLDSHLEKDEVASAFHNMNQDKIYMEQRFKFKKKENMKT